MRPWITPLSGARLNVPVAPDTAAFGVRRKHHTHEGVDLHCPAGTFVQAVTSGVVVWIGQFTGPELGHPWWLPTHAVMVEGEHGVIVYGEIMSNPDLFVGLIVPRGRMIGNVINVLPQMKCPRPAMLHMELRKHGHTELFDWTHDVERPDWLLDPTPFLQDTH